MLLKLIRNEEKKKEDEKKKELLIRIQIVHKYNMSILK